MVDLHLEAILSNEIRYHWYWHLSNINDYITLSACSHRTLKLKGTFGFIF